MSKMHFHGDDGLAQNPPASRLGVFDTPHLFVTGQSAARSLKKKVIFLRWSIYAVSWIQPSKRDDRCHQDIVF